MIKHFHVPSMKAPANNILEIETPERYASAVYSAMNEVILFCLLV